MKGIIFFVSVIVTALLFQIIYESIIRRRSSNKVDRMESSINDGCQTSISLIVFGVISVGIVGGIWYFIHK